MKQFFCLNFLGLNFVTTVIIPLECRCFMSILILVNLNFGLVIFCFSNEAPKAFLNIDSYSPRNSTLKSSILWSAVSITPLTAGGRCQ
jgi:type IV secretory pathway VirB3-like protein